MRARVYVGVFVCVCARARARSRVCACARALVCASVCACVQTAVRKARPAFRRVHPLAVALRRCSVQCLACARGRSALRSGCAACCAVRALNRESEPAAGWCTRASVCVYEAGKRGRELCVPLSVAQRRSSSARASLRRSRPLRHRRRNPRRERRASRLGHRLRRRRSPRGARDARSRWPCAGLATSHWVARADGARYVQL